jgi:hypothetical protein
VRFTLSFSLLCVSHFLFPYCGFHTFFFLIVRFTLSFSLFCVSHFLFLYCAFHTFFFLIVCFTLSFSLLCILCFLFPHCAFGAYESVIFCLDFDPFFSFPPPLVPLSGVFSLFIYLFVACVERHVWSHASKYSLLTCNGDGRGGGGSSSGVSPLK